MPKKKPATIKQLWFVGKDGKARKVCQVEHRAAEHKAYHCVPKNAKWFGLVEFVGDLRASLREAKKDIRRKMAKYNRNRSKLTRINPAPVFSAYHKNLLADVEKTKPAMDFEFSYKEESNG